MKRVLSFLLAALLLLTLVVTTALAQPEAEPTAEPEAVTAESPAPAETPEEEPAEPTAEPTEEPVAEATAEPTEAPVEETAEPTAEPMVEPTAEPVAAPVAAPPAESALLPQAEPTEAPAQRIVVVHRGEGLFPAPRAAYAELNVTLDANGALPSTAALKEEKGWYQPVRAGYRFDGWTTDPAGGKVGKLLREGDAVEEEVEDLYPCWVRVVELDAEPGSFWDTQKQEDNNYTRVVDLTGDTLPMTLPEPLYDYTLTKEQQTVEFIGWYTEETTMTRNDDGEGAYWEWDIQTHGEKVEPGTAVKAGVTTLYAGYKLRDDVSAKKEVTFYLDWNGIDGMWGPCLSLTRAYDPDKGGYELTAGDLAVWSLNWDGGTSDRFDTQADLDAYWKDRTFDGYRFLGWSTQTPGEADSNPHTGNVTAGVTVVTNGQSLYAIWERDDDGTNSWTYDRSGPEVGPLEFMRFADLRPSAHATKENTITVSLLCAPIGAELHDVTWTLRFSDGTLIGAFKGQQTTVTEDAPFEGKLPAGDGGAEVDYGFTARASGGVLTITNTDGQEHAIAVTATAKSVREGEPIDVTTPAETLAHFSHNVSGGWTVAQAPTCTEAGKETAECADCHGTVERKLYPLGHAFDFSVIKEPSCTEEGIYGKMCLRDGCGKTYADYLQEMDMTSTYHEEAIPATGHTYQAVEQIRVDNGAPVYEVACIHDDDVTEAKCGDADNDGRDTVADVTYLFRAVSGQIDQQFANEIGDADGDGRVTVADVTYLFRYVSGQIKTLH